MVCTRVGKRAIPNQSQTISLWKKTPYANLARCIPSGTYFARIRVGGKLIRQSLEAKSMTVAKLKLPEFELKQRAKIERLERLQGEAAFVGERNGSMTQLCGPEKRLSFLNCQLKKLTRCAASVANSHPFPCPRRRRPQ